MFVTGDAIPATTHGETMLIALKGDAAALAARRIAPRHGGTFNRFSKTLKIRR
jgi:hypothetical protein